MPVTRKVAPIRNRKPVLSREPSVPPMAAGHFDALWRSLSRETSSGRYIPEMDGLRFLAIGMVVLFHLNAYLMAKSQFYEHGVVGRDWLCRSALVGSHGVELFFVISGFILALPFAAHRLAGGPAVNLRKYYLRRLSRLEPPYIVTLFGLMFLALWFVPARQGVSGAHAAASLFYLHNLIYGAPSTVLGVAWSLEIEVQFYMLVPALTLLFAIRNSILRRWLMVSLALLAIAAQAALRQIDPRFALSIVGYLQFFMVGFLLADIFLLEWSEPSRRARYWDFVALIGWPALFFCLQSQSETRWLFPALILALYAAAFRGRSMPRLLSNRWLTTIGGMCYSIYLIHYEVISAVGRFTKSVGEGLPNPLYLLLQLALVSTAIILICGAYFFLLEKPCMTRDWPRRLWEHARPLLPLAETEAKATFAD